MTAPTLRTIEVRGLPIAYREAGTGPLVVLLHGFPDTFETYTDLQVALAAAGYRTVAPALRGYDPTGIPPDGDYSVATMAGDVLGLMDALGARDAAVIGHDWGASIAHATANLAPERVRALITLAIPHPRVLRVSPRLLWRAPHFVLFQFGRLSDWMVARNDLAYIDHLYRYWAPNWATPPDQLARVKAALRKPGRLRAALAFYECVVRDARDRDKQRLYRQRTSVPTLAIAGVSDGALDVAVYDRTPEAFTGRYEQLRIQAAGHFPHREAPGEVHARIAEFLASLATGAC